MEPLIPNQAAAGRTREQTGPKEGPDPWQPAADLCRALGHPVRLRILAYLRAAKGCLCGQIVDVLPLAQSTVSQHLKILKDVGLITGQIEGPRTCYCIDQSKLEQFKNMVARL
jgi:DNA-binding transcriptional ArsR family regulator